MNYLVSFSEDDLELLQEALDLAAGVWAPNIAPSRHTSEEFRRMRTELAGLKIRQEAA
jgi:hypothetical protein